MVSTMAEYDMKRLVYPVSPKGNDMAYHTGSVEYYISAATLASPPLRRRSR